jgi:uroporphyrinogen decarboxylase
MDPVILDTKPEIVRNQVLKILEAMRNRPGHIFNLGHGIHPAAKIENMETLVETVVGYKG